MTGLIYCVKKNMCNAGQWVDAVQVNLTPLISRDALATDASCRGHLLAIVRLPCRTSGVQDPPQSSRESHYNGAVTRMEVRFRGVSVTVASEYRSEAVLLYNFQSYPQFIDCEI